MDDILKKFRDLERYLEEGIFTVEHSNTEWNDRLVPPAIESNYIDAPCSLYNHQVTRFQVGTGAAANGGDIGTEEASTVSLGQPLTKAQYGNSLMSVNVTPGILYSGEKTALDNQDFGLLTSKSVVGSSIVHVWSLDEETANGQTLNEAGLFVQNPYLKERGDAPLVETSPRIQLVGGSVGGGPTEDALAPYYQPGHLLAAYKKFKPIQKENYFSLLFRWTISFQEES